MQDLQNVLPVLILVLTDINERLIEFGGSQQQENATNFEDKIVRLWSELINVLQHPSYVKINPCSFKKLLSMNRSKKQIQINCWGIPVYHVLENVISSFLSEWGTRGGYEISFLRLD